MFLEQIATETPEAAAALFELRDAKAWQEKYHVSAGWLDAFLTAALDRGQDRFDWITAKPNYFDNPTQMLVSASATAWKQVITSFKASHVIWRELEKAGKGRIIYSDPTEDKRNARRACGWLVSWLFARMSYEAIQIAAGVASWQIVERTAKKFAKTIGLKIEPQQGRRPPQHTHLRKSKKKS